MTFSLCYTLGEKGRSWQEEGNVVRYDREGGKRE